MGIHYLRGRIFCQDLWSLESCSRLYTWQTFYHFLNTCIYNPVFLHKKNRERGVEIGKIKCKLWLKVGDDNYFFMLAAELKLHFLRLGGMEGGIRLKVKTQQGCTLIRLTIAGTFAISLVFFCHVAGDVYSSPVFWVLYRFLF